MKLEIMTLKMSIEKKHPKTTEANLEELEIQERAECVQIIVAVQISLVTAED